MIKQRLQRMGLNRMRWLAKARGVRDSGCSPRAFLRYVLFDPELENYTYDIANKDELAAWVDSVCGGGRYVRELDEDAELRAELDARTARRPSAKTPMYFGRRLGWYAVARATEPELIVETGTHDGLGSVALLAALERNGRGRLISIDPRPGTGWLVPDRLRARWTQLHATSQDVLAEIDGIDLFIHDSLHTAEVERWELETAAGRGARVLLSDNAHVLPTLQDYAGEIGARFSLWRERPLDHFYGGAGIGAAVREAAV